MTIDDLEEKTKPPSTQLKTRRTLVNLFQFDMLLVGAVFALCTHFLPSVPEN